MDSSLCPHCAVSRPDSCSALTKPNETGVPVYCPLYQAVFLPIAGVFFPVVLTKVESIVVKCLVSQLCHLGLGRLGQIT